LLTRTEKKHAVSGAACCLLSALAYTVSNIAMRQLTTLRCDPFLAIFGRELVTTLMVALWLAYRAMHRRNTQGDGPIFVDTKIGTVPRQPTLPSGRTLCRILLVGVLIQVVGNGCFQWTLGVVGLALTVPIVSAVSITSGAVLGYFVLGERVSARSTASIALLLASLGLLGMGAGTVGESIAAADAATIAPYMIALGVAAAGLAGVVFSLLNITIRHSVTRATSPLAVAFLVPLSGVASLGPIAAVRSGVPALLGTSSEQLLWMAASGFFNLIAFLAFVYGLQRTTVIHANVVSASQVAMAAVAGMALFHESPDPWLVVGISLTILGIILVDRPVEAFEDIPPP
jgi:drug/metabolite transporter, DME family